MVIRHFAEAGYDGGSLSTVAGAAGIRKASLYSHFSGKDDLFLTSLQRALEIEKAHLEQAFQTPQPDGAGSAFVAGIAERHVESDALRFILRAAYLLPKTIGAEVGAGYAGYLDLLRRLYLRQSRVERPHLAAEDRAQLAEAYVGIVESLFVELLYGTANTTVARRDALWRVLSQAMRHG